VSNFNRAGAARRMALEITLPLMVATALVACGPATPEPVDTAHLIGRWELQTDDQTEWIHLKTNGKLSAEIGSNAFLATTIPAEPGAELQGEWKLEGNDLEIRIEGAEVPLIYRIASLTDRTMTTVKGDGTRHILRKGL
jgi:hypothetical protein